METPVHQIHAYLLRREAELVRAEGLPQGLLRLVSFGRFLATVAVEFLDDHCLQMAAALSYSSLLALVPVVTLFFSVFTAFAAFSELRRDMERFLMQQLFMNEEVGKTILAKVDEFSLNARQLGIFAVVALIVTVIFLLLTVENSLNSIWRVPLRRSMMTRVTTYSALVFLGPVLLALSFSLTNQTIRALVLDAHLHPGLWKFISGVSVSCFMFFLVYMVVPETRVQLRPALAGGLVAGALFEWAKWGFDQYLQRSHFYEDVYQTLGIVPIFLVWLYLVWLITLLGMEITYVCQNTEHLRNDAKALSGDQEISEASLVATMVQIAKNFYEGRAEESDQHNLASELGLPLYRIIPILGHLEANGFVHRLADHSDTFIPRAPLAHTTVHDLLETLHSDQVFTRMSERDRRFLSLRDAFLKSLVYRDELFDSMSLLDVVRSRRES